MEENHIGNISDRDKRMMEIQRDKEKEAAKEKKKTPKRSLFLGQDKEAEQPEKKPASFESADKDAEKPVDTEVDDYSLEELSTEEKNVAAQQYIDQRGEDLREELSGVEHDSEAEAVVLADAALLELLTEKLENGEELTDENLDLATAEIARGLYISESGSNVLQETEEELLLDYENDQLPADAHPRVGLSHIGTELTGQNRSDVEPHVRQSQTVVEIPRSRGPDLLIGGLVGYMIGRRGGRIRTEAKLIPLQEKLAQEVKDLHEKIELSEQKIRSLTTRRIESDPDVSPTRIIERLEHRTNQRTASREHVSSASTESAPEKLTANIDTVSVPQLLEIARSISYEGVSVKQMFEAGRLDSVGLRRVVREYLRGGDYDHVLSRELKGVEYAHEQAAEHGRSHDGTSGLGGLAGLGVYAGSKDKESGGLPTRSMMSGVSRSNKTSPTDRISKPVNLAVIIGLLVSLVIIAVLNS